MFSVIWEEIDPFADAPPVEAEREFDTLSDALSWAELLDNDPNIFGVMVWDNDVNEEIPWPW